LNDLATNESSGAVDIDSIDFGISTRVAGSTSTALLSYFLCHVILPPPNRWDARVTYSIRNTARWGAAHGGGVDALEPATSLESYGACRYFIQILGLIACIFIELGESLRSPKSIFDENHHGRFLGLGSLWVLRIFAK
jgi:hypothetical protein